MAIRAQSEFVSILGNYWRVSILDNNYSGSVIPFKLKGDGFVKTYESPGDELYETLKATRVKISVPIYESDTDLISLIEDAAKAPEERFFITLERANGDPNVNPYRFEWIGNLLSDLIREPDKWPSTVELSATDGIGRLKDLFYAPDPLDPYPGDNVFSGYATFKEILIKCLEYTGTAGQMAPANDFLKSFVHWYEAGMSATDEALDFARIDETVFIESWDYEKRERLAMKVQDVLRSVLKAWGSRLVFERGVWNVIPINESVKGSSIATTYARTGAINSSGSESLTNGIDQVVDVRLATPVKRYFPALSKVEATHKIKFSGNLLPLSSNYWDGYGGPVNFPAIGGSFGSSGDKLRFRSFLTFRLYNRSNSVNFYLPDSVLLLSHVVKIGPHYLVKGFSESSPRWENNGFEQSVITGTPFIGVIPPGDERTIRVSIDFTSGPLPITNIDPVDTSFKSLIGLPNGTNFYTPSTQSATSTSLNIVVLNQGGNPYDPAHDGKVAIVRENNYTEIVLLPDGEQPKESEFYYVDNITANRQTSEDVGEIIFGDLENAGEPGAIQVKNGATWQNAAGQWEDGSFNGSSKFIELLIRKRLETRIEPPSVIDMTIQSKTVDALVTWSFKGELFIFNGGEFNARLDRLKGTFVQVGLKPASVGNPIGGGIITLPPGPGGGTLPGLGDVSDPPVISGPGSNPNDVNRIIGTLAGAASVSTLTSAVEPGLTSEISISALGEVGVISQGDVLTLFSPSLVSSITIIAAEDMEPGDTTLSIEEVEFFDYFAEGSYLITSGQAASSKGDKQYKHNQTTTAATWTINHNLEKFPSVTVVDSSGRKVLGEIQYPDDNTVILTFSAAFSGSAYLN